MSNKPAVAWQALLVFVRCMSRCMAAGEILPQALCKSYALVIGAHTAWLVKFLMWACGIISWPISKLLDWLLGSEHTVRLHMVMMMMMTAASA